MDEFKIIIAGGRKFNDYKLLKSTVDNLLAEKSKTHKIIVFCGLASGADTLGDKYAKEKGYEVRYFPAKWTEQGKTAGIIRNIEMADNADALVAFWDGQSPGTKHMINAAKERGLKVRIKLYNDRNI